MPIALESTKNIQMVRDKAFYGLKPHNLKTPKKSVPWVDVSDEEERRKQSSVKRKVSAINGNSHYIQNGHKHKKHRRSDSVNNDIGNQMNGDMNGAGSSQTKQSHHNHNGTGHTSQHSKAIQEQRTQLPIAKGVFFCGVVSLSTSGSHLIIGRDALIERIRKNDVTVLLGETGSGKTTRECNLVSFSICTWLITCRGTTVHSGKWFS